MYDPTKRKPKTRVLNIRYDEEVETILELLQMALGTKSPSATVRVALKYYSPIVAMDDSGDVIWRDVDGVEKVIEVVPPTLTPQQKADAQEHRQWVLRNRRRDYRNGFSSWE